MSCKEGRNNKVEWKGTTTGKTKTKTKTVGDYWHRSQGKDVSRDA